jgi:hypothetical protein
VLEKEAGSAGGMGRGAAEVGARPSAEEVAVGDAGDRSVHHIAHAAGGGGEGYW